MNPVAMMVILLGLGLVDQLAARGYVNEIAVISILIVLWLLGPLKLGGVVCRWFAASAHTRPHRPIGHALVGRPYVETHDN